MERKQTSIAIIVMLVIAFAITLTGWVRARNDLLNYKTSNNIVAETETDLSVCDDIRSANDEKRCTERLAELSLKLSQYEEVIRNIRSNR